MISVYEDFSCEVCLKMFSSQASLKLHMRRNHSGAKFCCYYCNHDTKFKHCLARHIRRYHMKKVNSQTKSISVKCPLCSYECGERQGMILHYGIKHSVAIQKYNLEFEEFKHFKKWKEIIEHAGVPKFIAYNGPKKRQTVLIRYYRCFRDGNFRKKGKGLRCMKMKGSVKMNGVCPASIKAEEDNTTGVVTVSYIYTHVGH